jgi:NAD(P)-dependent dehydrogenase (short-subunit alcohol dehydrogenase family)
MDLGLNDRVILVLGGHGLVGRAVVERLREEGAVAVPASRHAPDGIVMDGGDDASVAEGIEGMLREHGRLDGLVVTAAPSARTLDPARNSDPGQVLQAVDGKAMTFLRAANAVAPIMAESGYGRIVGVSGQNAFVTGNVAGSVRNAALIIVAKNLADSLAGTGVTVNAVSPSTVTETPSREVALGRGGEARPGDTAALIAFLLSPLAGAISGESIAVGHRVRGMTGL